MVRTVRPKAKATPRKPMPSSGKPAAKTALPHPPNTSQKVPRNSERSLRLITLPLCYDCINYYVQFNRSQAKLHIRATTDTMAAKHGTGRVSDAWKMERVKGIEPSYSAWEAAALPLSYTRAAHKTSDSSQRVSSTRRVGYSARKCLESFSPCA
ncbi:hypothetical protein AGR7C_Cc260218 [Agrobacterium deltaense Zutra 3/1]|uniref:Uncharacterized protein n=1 Tax=Agrobacterium deltaense Zutra 3/1 TaxID=1183427 RepID=A0A1S7Q8A6_9HYPH|nr:hypothetical protein AGR7C_Cc260218 [Agrobacterium deltaense Zutra 3/1]